MIFPPSLIRPLLVILFASLFASCSNSPEYYGVTELFHGRPKPVPQVPRTIFGSMPSGPFDTQDPQRILVMDSGADYNGETGFTYIEQLLERYVDKGGQGDLPVHYFITPDGKVFTGRQQVTPAEIYQGDPFTLRSDEVTRQEMLMARLKRRTSEKLNLQEFIVIMALGDYDQMMVSKEQEKQLFQLISYLTYELKIPREEVYGLREIYPSTKNPGFYLNNYLQASILEKNVPPPPTQHRFLLPPVVNQEES